MIRNNLSRIKRKLRQHFNKNKKCKIIFENEEKAIDYLNKRKLKNYTIYKCNICSKYHISKKY